MQYEYLAHSPIYLRRMDGWTDGLECIDPFRSVVTGSFRNSGLDKWPVKIAYLSVVFIVLGPVNHVSIVAARDAYIVRNALWISGR
jgi:hypothetical protein